MYGYTFVGAYPEFDIVSSSDFVTQNLPYHSKSLMHFFHNQYSENGGDTLQGAKDILDYLLFGLNKLPNKLDYLHINLLYCGGKQATMSKIISEFTLIVHVLHVAIYSLNSPHTSARTYTYVFK